MTDLIILLILSALCVLYAYSLFQWRKEYKHRLYLEKRLAHAVYVNRMMMERGDSDSILEAEILEIKK